MCLLFISNKIATGSRAQDLIPTPTNSAGLNRASSHASTRNETRTQYYTRQQRRLDTALPPMNYQALSTPALDSSELSRFRHFLTSITHHQDWDFAKCLEQHKSVYSLAKFAEVPDLQEYALGGLRLIFGAIGNLQTKTTGIRNFISLIDIVFRFTDDADLQNLVVRNATWHSSKLLLEPEYEELLGNGGSFTKELTMNFTRQVQHGDMNQRTPSGPPDSTEGRSRRSARR
jgi:hypothetical protein